MVERSVSVSAKECAGVILKAYGELGSLIRDNALINDALTGLSDAAVVSRVREELMLLATHTDSTVCCALARSLQFFTSVVQRVALS